MNSKKLIATLLLLGASWSCSDFLTGEGLTVNPNLPVTASKEQFFAAVATSQQSEEEGTLARLASMFTQQMAGTGRQHATYQLYSITESDVTTFMSRTYTGGGLVDVRRAEELAKAQGDSVFAGVSMVYEARRSLIQPCNEKSPSLVPQPRNVNVIAAQPTYAPTV